MRLVAAILLLCTANSGWGATIRVAQDGSGDYTSVFDGLAAAQDGDTVSIGPGEYTETRLINPSGQFEFEVLGFISASDVTVVGDDRNAVIIGPPAPPAVFTSNGVRGLVVELGVASGVVFSDLTVRNVSRGLVDVDYAASVRACRLVGNYYGIWQSGLGACFIEDSEFEDNGAGIVALAGYGSRDLQIRDCTFVDNIQGMQIQNPQTTVSRCTIAGGDRGILAVLGGNVIVQDCTISNTASKGVDIYDGSAMWLYDNLLQGTMEYNVFVVGALTGGGNLLSGGTVASLWLGPVEHLEFFGNHILNGGALSVWALDDLADARTLSLENNWWGTSDSAQIEEWIYHAPDDPETNGLTIDYMPFYGGPVPTEASSVGRLKGQFGRR